MKYCGKDFLIQKEDLVTPLTYNTVAALRSTGMSINNEQVDVTEKGSMPWRQLIECGVRTISLTGAGIFTDDATHDELVADAMTDGQTIRNFQIVSGRGDKFAGPFQIASLERTGEYNGAEEYSISLESAGAIVYTPAP